MPAPIAIYMPAAQAVLLRIGDDTIELQVARLDELAWFLRDWSFASVTIGNDTGRVTIAAGQGSAVAGAIVNALATRDHAVNMLAAA